MAPVSGCNGETQRIAMAHRVDLGPVSRAIDKRIVRRNGAVVAQPQHFACEVVRILRMRGLRRIANADRHVNHAVFAENDPRSVAGRNGGEDIADIDERRRHPSARARE